MTKELEICCDASIRKFNEGTCYERTFGCAGAIALGYNMRKFLVLPDSTNNRSEITAIKLAVQLAKEILDVDKEITGVTIYSDSKFSVYGLTVWMDSWLQKRGKNGVLYNYSGQPVKNQNVFLEIIKYLYDNQLKIKFRHQKGHIKATNEKDMAIANKVFYDSNGYYIDQKTLSRISYYNGIIDEETRNILRGINATDYIMEEQDKKLKEMCYYIVPYDYKKCML